jgi:hypothetical protein
MQEPDYHLFFRQWQKQNLRSAFWGRSVLLGPISVILGTTQRQDVMISGGLSKLNDRFPSAIMVAENTRLFLP